ncbi:MAG: 1-deoxy-D-xylulose-5-phosphate reductoisomerase [Acidobacteria bacterium RIFCSPLOWO2_02_FULL_68_18]|nr:MAG: 1-deoxy-D-xylulose-5-phosphate reductoisomerase [Acidobacteria bacterium RIFCSPLOWO2_02_FULL_68_18]OFW48436.1 MAG: 1-deoxy-D-xylulose-5-phosphate reductoisomerase [Acidobacteria bacterium RIFCSPLOWO2_12_FULL_68_19]
MKRVAILGSTGSIGRSALAVVDAHPTRLKVVALAAGDNAALLSEQVARYGPEVVAMATGDGADRLKAICGAGVPPSVGVGAAGLVGVATHPSADIVICASAGTAGLEAVLAAIEAGKTVALANKEVLVMAGSLVTRAAARRGVGILPVDSEHNAIHQCLHGRPPSEIRRVILTASGGPFRDYDAGALARVDPEAALQHPTWQMGRKITIDSATLMNKGLEVIEAHWLFGVSADQIDVLIHPQSIVHSMVELIDGSVIAQLGVTDMRLPIQYACSYPERWGGALPSLDLTRAGRLEFLPPSPDRFPCLALAYRALRAEGTLPVVVNAANEVAVDAFLRKKLAFTAIPRVIEETMNAHVVEEVSSLPVVRRVDRWAREYAGEMARELELNR